MSIIDNIIVTKTIRTKEGLLKDVSFSIDYGVLKAIKSLPDIEKRRKYFAEYYYEHEKEKKYYRRSTTFTDF